MPDSHLVTLNSEAREELHWWLHTPNLTFGVRDSVGQLNDSILLKQTGRHSLPVAEQTSPRSLGLVRPAPDHSYCSAPSGSGQRPSGCTVQGKLLPHGVEPAQTNLHVTMAGVVLAICRHVRDGQKLPASSVLLSGSGSEGQRNECADHELGSDLQICISPNRSDPPGTEEITQTPDSNYLPDSPIRAQPDMVQAANQPPSRCSQEAPRPVEPPQELGDSRALPRAGQTKLTARKLSADQSLRKCMVPRHMLCTDYKYSNIRTVM